MSFGALITKGKKMRELGLSEVQEAALDRADWRRMSGRCEDVGTASHTMSVRTSFLASL